MSRNRPQRPSGRSPREKQADVCSDPQGGNIDQGDVAKTRPGAAGELLERASDSPETPVEIRMADLLVHGVLRRAPACRLARMPEERRLDLVLRWAQELAAWRASVGVPWDVVRTTLQYVQEHDHWSRVVLGPERLRQSWDAIRASMGGSHGVG